MSAVDSTSSVLTQSLLVVAALVVALACLPAIVRALQSRWPLKRVDSDHSLVLGSVIAVGPNQRVATVHISGSGPRRHLVLGISPGTIHCLASWDDGAESAALSARVGPANLPQAGDAPVTPLQNAS